MTDFERKDKYTVADFRRLMEVLRGPGGCPWDAEQTHESIRNNVLEEAYEVAGAIDSGDTENLKEELGDLLMQVLFHARMEEEKGVFDLDDVADGACKKLIFRHPHVFGDVEAGDTQAVLQTWEEAKRREKHQDSAAKAMADVAEALPALWRAAKIQKKAAAAGLEQSSLSQALEGVRARAAALAEGAGDPEETVGALLYLAVRAAALLGVDPENALHRCCADAIARYALAEKAAGGGETPEKPLFQAGNA
ncbi:MAG: nucleoside triphosphate pyrophosphohydrolase [Oscillospiraceae bacterium]